MRQIALYKFDELKLSVEYNVVEQHSEYIKEICDHYIKNEFIPELIRLASVLLPTFHINIDIDSDSFLFSITGRDMTEKQSNCVLRGHDCYDCLKDVITDVVQIYPNYSDVLSKALEQYNNKHNLMQFMYSVFNKLVSNAFFWYINMLTDTKFAVNYILGSQTDRYVDSTLFFKDIEFFEDGTIANI